MFHRPTIIGKIKHHDAMTTLERKTCAGHISSAARISQKLRRPARKHEVVRSRVRSGFSCQESRITEGCRAASKIVNGCICTLIGTHFATGRSNFRGVCSWDPKSSVVQSVTRFFFSRSSVAWEQGRFMREARTLALPG